MAGVESDRAENERKLFIACRVLMTGCEEEMIYEDGIYFRHQRRL